ncbi:MAG: AMP-binding protein [Planctomycetes bacterium]|nr:AMP-binding protein [Planctomycetota bacterium]
MNQQLATEASFAAEAPPANLVDLLRFWARQSGARTAFTFQRDDRHETALTYAELDLRARAIAARLQQSCRPGDRALLLFPAGLDFIAAFFGCAYAGVLAVPVCYPKPKRPMPRLLSIARNAEARVALTNRKTLEQFDFHAAHAELSHLKWIASDDARDESADAWSPHSADADEVAFLQYTSGSTSEPRGVMVSHANLLHNLEVIRHGFGIEFDLHEGEPHNKGVFWLPAYHDMGLIGGILTPLYVGGHSLLMSPGAFLHQPFRWLEAISEGRATISGAPNFAYDLCVAKIPEEKRRGLDLSCWDISFCGAEPIQADSLESFAAAFRECGFRREAFYPCYGLAENTLMTAGGEGPGAPRVKTVVRDAMARRRVAELNGDRSLAVQELICCGAAVLDQEIAIVDPDTQRRCARNEVGEIWIKGPSVAQGYWNCPEQTEATFRARITDDGDGPYLRTGDLGFLEDDQLYVTGRLKDVIIIRGRNHYPQDIERTAERAHEALRPNAGAAVSIEAHGEEALVVIHEIDRAHRDVDLNEVARCIRRAVADEHEINPHAIVLIRHASLPVTTSGKVQRSLCRRLYLAGDLKVLQEWVAPQHLGGLRLRVGVDRLKGIPANGAAKAGGPAKLNGVHHGNGAHRKNGHANHAGNGSHAGNGRKNGASQSGNGAGAHANGQHGAKNGVSVMASSAHHAAAAQHRASGSAPPRLEFDHLPLSAEEIDRLAERIEAWILDWLVEQAGVHSSEIDRDKPFAELGLDSLTAVELSQRLEAWLGVELNAVIAWNYPTPHKIANYLARQVGGAEGAAEEAAEATAAAAGEGFERLLAEIEDLSDEEVEDALAEDPLSRDPAA